MFAQIVLASWAGMAWAAPCVAPPASPDSIAEFKLNPDALVAPNADTRSIEARVRELAGTSASLAPDLVNLAQGATPRHRTAIAAGLAQAAVACSNVDQQAALQIQQAVASFENGQFQASFAAVAGDLSTSATAAAAYSASGNAGSVVIVNPNRSTRLTSNPGGGGGRSAVVQITSGTIVINAAGTPDAGTTTAADPVSPTR
ncbi:MULTISPECIES: hypothetical protein [unclassified Bradyrhizobium]|uniref:hypothetical protein n=1 Tax=unclassified Bradyrhizobium TaxID=2631580 RepID=UPI002FF1FA6E